VNGQDQTSSALFDAIMGPIVDQSTGRRKYDNDENIIDIAATFYMPAAVPEPLPENNPLLNIPVVKCAERNNEERIEDEDNEEDHGEENDGGRNEEDDNAALTPSNINRAADIENDFKLPTNVTTALMNNIGTVTHYNHGMKRPLNTLFGQLDLEDNSVAENTDGSTLYGFTMSNLKNVQFHLKKMIDLKLVDY
jgi:hypothetical protein